MREEFSMKTDLHMSRFLIPVLAMVLTGGLGLCQAPPEMPPMDDVSFLKDALQAAEAPALTSEQERSIRALIAKMGANQFVRLMLTMPGGPWRFGPPRAAQCCPN